MPGSVWIQRGPDGRPHFVRDKPQRHSLRDILSKTVLPPSARSFFSRDIPAQDQPQTTTVDHRLIMPPSHPAGLAPVQGYSPSPHEPHSQPESLPQSTNQSVMPPPLIQNSQAYQYHPGQFADKNIQCLLRPPEQQFWPFPHPATFPVPANAALSGLPHPAIFPVPANAAVPGLPPPLFSSQQPMFAHPTPPGADRPAPIPGYPYTSIPPGAPTPIQRQIPLPVTQETRYKCEICGRYRSARYHYKHPIPSGHPPAKTICRKCQAEATDSDDDSASGGVDLNRPHRHLSRPASRSRISSRRLASKPGPLMRARPYSPQRDMPFDDYDEFSPSDSDSLVSDGFRGQHRSGNYRRAETSRMGLPRRVHRLRQSPVDYEIYIDDNRTPQRIAQQDGLPHHENDHIRFRR